MSSLFTPTAFLLLSLSLIFSTACATRVTHLHLCTSGDVQVREEKGYTANDVHYVANHFESVRLAFIEEIDIVVHSSHTRRQAGKTDDGVCTSHLISGYPSIVVSVVEEGQDPLRWEYVGGFWNGPLTLLAHINEVAFPHLLFGRTLDGALAPESGVSPLLEIAIANSLLRDGSASRVVDLLDSLRTPSAQGENMSGGKEERGEEGSAVKQLADLATIDSISITSTFRSVVGHYANGLRMLMTDKKGIEGMKSRLTTLKKMRMKSNDQSKREAEIEKNVYFSLLRILLSNSNLLPHLPPTAMQRAYRSAKVPRIVHFIKTDGDPSHFTFVHMLSIASAKLYLKPKKIFFHASVVPTQSPHWRMIEKYVKVMKAEPPMQLGGKPLRLAAHQSDAWRMKVLSRLGGLYLDWDVIVQRDIFALLKSDFTLGMERFDNALGVAVIASTPDAKFLNIWQKEMEARFNPECYTCHSVTAVREIARDNPLQVDLLHWKRFYYPGWEDEAMGALIDWRVRGVTLEDLRERPALPENGPRLPSLSLDATFCLHLFESHANAVKRLGDRSHSLISHQRIWSHPSPSPFEVMARAILEHLDEGKRKEEL